MAQKLFIGGLAFSTSTERLREAFAAAGQVESAAVVTDRDTGRSRGFGFVEMSTAEEADQAIAQFNGKDLDGRQLRVEKASAGGAAVAVVADPRGASAEPPRRALVGDRRDGGAFDHNRRGTKKSYFDNRRGVT